MSWRGDLAETISVKRKRRGGALRTDAKIKVYVLPSGY